ncbi:MAG TPA: thioredoxin domain-containing protein [Rhizomicrobium sp.]
MNRLADEASPYLQLHKNDPVDWHVWGPEAFAAAQAQNKPILLSIGYTACHWCHVMEQESFSDPETGAALNADFICIKVDREERPDIDQLYQAAATLIGHNGGWPLTAFLDPQGTPFAIGGYFPKEERAGQPQPFRRAIAEVARTYRESDAFQTAAANIRTQMDAFWNRDLRGPVDAGTHDSAALRVGQSFDIFFGGVTGTMKFPSVTLMDVLWRAYLRSGTPQFLQLFSTSLDHMLLGGLTDHVGGGFCRYCRDERWIVPHWEKMLFDNALILDMMTQVWQHNRNKLCEQRIAETVAFLLRDMRKEAAFATSIHSDSEGEEGKYYLWTEAELDAALAGTFAAKFKSAYGVSRTGNLQDGRNILLRLGAAAPFPQSDADEALFAKQRSLLLAARQKRVAPIRDDKVLADLNGMTIVALANAAAAMQRPDWMAAAVEAFDFVVKAHGDGDRLRHSWRDASRTAQGYSDDYAHMARAALALYEYLGDKRYLDHAKTWVRALNDHHWDNERGGYFLVADDSQTLIIRTRPTADQPVPGANTVMIQVLARLAMATADQQYIDRLNSLVGAFAGEAARAYMSMGSFFSGLEFAMSNLQFVVIGPPNHPRTHELANAILGRALPNRFLTVMKPEDDFPLGHPMHGRTMQDGQPSAFICQRGTCSPPITNPVALSQMLQLPPQRQAPRPQ